MRWGRVARHNSLTRLKKTAYGAQTVSCGASAKGGVHPQSKVGWICKGAVQTQRWGRNAKGQPKLS